MIDISWDSKERRLKRISSQTNKPQSKTYRIYWCFALKIISRECIYITSLVLHSSNVNLKGETSSNKYKNFVFEYFTFPGIILKANLWSQVQIQTGTKALLHI